MTQTVTRKQCTESRTGLGALVHTQRTLPVCTLRRVAGLAWRRCKSGPAVSQAWAAVSPRPPCSVLQRFPRPCRVYITTQPAAKPLPHCHDTIDCIVTRPQPDCPLVMIQRLYRDTIPPAASLRACHDTPIRIATQSLSHSNRRMSRYNRLYRDTLPSQTACHDCYFTIQFIVS